MHIPHQHHLAFLHHHLSQKGAKEINTLAAVVVLTKHPLFALWSTEMAFTNTRYVMYFQIPALLCETVWPHFVGLNLFLPSLSTAVLARWLGAAARQLQKT